MVNVVNIQRDLADLPMLKNRVGHPTDEESRQSFAQLYTYRDGGIFVAHFQGDSGWERHPKGDEVVQILEGDTHMNIIVDDVVESLDLSAGMMVVVPQGCWHRFRSDTGVKVMTTTPRPTEHTHVEDPRTETAAE